MFWFKKKAIQKDIKIILEESNSLTVLNAELSRMHDLLRSALREGQSKNNLTIWWNNIHSLQSKLLETLDKQSDPDLAKKVKDLQDHILDQLILED